MERKPTRKEWFDRFEKEFSEEISKFRHSDTPLFGSGDIAEELRCFAGAVVRDMYRVKLDIAKAETYGKGVELTLTDYNGVQFYAAEYYEGRLSLGVTDGNKVVHSHVLQFESREADRTVVKAIKLYLGLFKATMDARNAIDELKAIY